MMQRRKLFFLILATALAPGVALAATIQDSIIAQLRDQGYQKITVTRTLLGRVRLVATRGGRKREIIFNPRTGEILRDLSSGGALLRRDDDDRSGKGSGEQRDRDDKDNKDEDDDDKDDDKDSSGGGGGSDDNSGSDDDDDD